MIQVDFMILLVIGLAGVIVGLIVGVSLSHPTYPPYR
jgi:hypothetical protein